MKTLILLIGICLAAGLGYVLLNKQNEFFHTELSPASQPAVEPMFVEPDPAKAALKVSGLTYQDPQGRYAFLYPEEYSLDHEGGDQSTRIVKRAVTARPQSEISDGVMVVFETVDLGEQTLEAAVDARIESSTANGLAELVQPKQSFSLNSYPAFSYELGGVGAAKHIVIQKNSQSKHAIVVSILVADPQGKGYQSEVDTILSTIELLK